MSGKPASPPPPSSLGGGAGGAPHAGGQSVEGHFLRSAKGGQRVRDLTYEEPMDSTSKKMPESIPRVK